MVTFWFPGEVFTSNGSLHVGVVVEGNQSHLHEQKVFIATSFSGTKSLDQLG